MKIIQGIKKVSLATIGLSLILGVIFIAFPAQVMTYLCLFLGIAMICIGVAAVINYLIDRFSAFTLVLGILAIILGVIVCTQYKAIISFMIILLGLFILTAGLFNFFTSIKIIASSLIFGWASLFLSVATTVLGIVALTHSADFSEALVRFIGVALIVYAVMDILTYIQVKQIAGKIKDVVDSTKDVETTATVVEESDIEEVEPPQIDISVEE